MHQHIENIHIHIWVAFNLITRICGHEIPLFSIFLFLLQFELWMQIPTLLLCMTINVTMVAVVYGIFAMVCCGWCIIFFFPPFHLFFPSLEASWCSFSFDPLNFLFFQFVFSKYCAYTQASSTNLGFNNITCFRRWLCKPPKYLRSVSMLFGEISTIMDMFLNFVYPYTFSPLPLWIYDGFETHLHSHLRISLQPQGICVAFPLDQGMAL